MVMRILTKRSLRPLTVFIKGHEILHRLGMFHLRRFQRFGRLDDVEKSIEFEVHALDLTPEGHPDLLYRHAALGVSYSERYRHLGEIDDLSKAIECDNGALLLTPSDHPDLPDRHANIGASYHDRYTRLGEPNDLEKAIESLSHALTTSPDNHPNLLLRHDALGVIYGDRFQLLGEMGDLEKSMEYRSRALSLTPGGHQDLARRHAALGASYIERYRRLGEIDDLEKAIGCDSRALELTPANHPDFPRRHADLGMSYVQRYKYLGELDDLDKAMEHKSRALKLTPDGHRDLPRRYADLGVLYTDRYIRLGDFTDLEKSLECDVCALTLTPEGHPHLSVRHSALGVSYASRYQRLGEIADLAKAIEHHSHALSLTPTGHPHLPPLYEALGTSYTKRYRHLHETSDLEKSIEYKSRALELTPHDHPHLPRRYDALGVSYTDRYRLLDKTDDLEKSIEFKSRALELTPDDHASLSRRYAALGVSYTDRYQCLGLPKDLEKSVECHLRALDLTPEGHPDLSLRHFNWALGCHDQYQHTHNPSHLNASLDAFRRSTQLLNSAPREVFKYAFEWAKLASRHSYLDRLGAFGTTIDLLPHFIWLGATTSQRYYDLFSAENVAVGAASAAILSSNYNLALEWLEHARCVVWTQSLMLRSPIDILKSSHPELATQLQSVAQQLNQANSESDLSADVPEHRYHLAREYNNLLAEARKLPGFEDLLQPTKYSDLVGAAKIGPIVIINCHEDHCDALLIMPGGDSVAHVPLPNFTGIKARHTRFEMENSIRNSRLNERRAERRPLQEEEEEEDFRSVLSNLWYDIVQPVLDYLGYTDKSDVIIDEMPHITWCPTGALSFLPLHAAGDYDQSRSRVFDYVISSYTPTLTALLSSTSISLSSDSRVLFIGQEATPGHQNLPGAAKELKHVVRHIEGRAGYSQLLGNQATVATVLDAMEQHDWVHLACHAHQNVQDPTESGFFLHDGILNLASINQRSFKRKGLAFLSACQTATGDEKLPDEAIHLASGMLMAGYSSVIATMWSVHDEDAPLVADRVYAQLMKDGKIGNGEAGKALHNAVGELRGKVGEKEFSRWVPYIHIGA
ncbi:TPR-like protein, partial [Rhizoctonia solani]